MDKPSYFFLAHVLVRRNGSKGQFANFKKLVPDASDTYIVKSENDPLCLTFVATFEDPVDFKAIEKKLSFTYGGKSKVLSVQYSTTNKPSYFYSAHLIQNFTLQQRHNGFAQQKQSMVKAAVALVATNPKVNCTLYSTSVLVEIADHDLRAEDIATINSSLRSLPHIALLTSREPKKE